jgi:Lysylphosphatidylglycerol synthase TM region
MLTTAGFDTDTAVDALTAFSLPGVGGLLALPIFALPAMLAGAPVRPGLVHTAILGIAAFVLFAVLGAVLLLTDRPLEVIARAAQGLANRLRRRRPPVTGLDRRVLAERDTIRAVLGKKWWQAVLLITGRLGFDYGCLLAALRATGAHPRPSLVLLAYSAAAILALFPITPGGLGMERFWTSAWATGRSPGSGRVIRSMSPTPARRHEHPPPGDFGAAVADVNDGSRVRPRSPANGR